MKRIWIVLVAILLVGCTVNETTLPSRMDAVVNEIDAMNITAETNHRRDYFDYYLPKHIGKRFSEQDNAIFVRNTHEFYMYLDVSEVIIDEYYKKLEKQIEPSEIAIGEVIYRKQGTMKNFASFDRSYDLSIEKVGKEFLVFLRFGVIQFTALLPLSELEGTIYDMFFIARSMKIDRAAVLADYSNKSVVVITNKYDLFETIFPESGVIAHVLNPSGGKGTVHEEATKTPNDKEQDPSTPIHEEPTNGNVDAE